MPALRLTTLSLCLFGLLALGCEESAAPDAGGRDAAIVDGGDADAGAQDSGPTDAGASACAPPCFAWVRRLDGPTDEDEIDAVASDAEGNVYVAGKFEQTLTVEGFDGPALESAGRADIMVAKYGPDGTLLWLHHFGGPGEDNVFDAACDEEGNLYLSGYFAGAVDFGGHVLESGGVDDLDMMVVRMDPRGEGAVTWAVSAGGDGSDGGNELELMPDGRMAVLAQSDGEFVAAPGVAFDPPEGRSDAFVLTMNTDDGAFEWGAQTRTSVGEGQTEDSVGARAKCLAVDADSNLYWGGDFTGTLSMDGAGVLPDEVESREVDGFVSSWTASGEHRWTRAFGGDEDDLCKGAVATADGLYLVGQFAGEVDFGGTALTSARRNLFVWALDHAGGTRWVQHVQANVNLLGAEAVAAPDGGVLFGFRMTADLTLSSSDGASVAVSRPTNDDYPVLLGYDAAGVPSLQLMADESSDANLDEISIQGRRVYVDVPIFAGRYRFGRHVRESTGSKDALLVAIDL